MLIEQGPRVTPTLGPCMDRFRLPMLQITEASSTSAISFGNPILREFLRRFLADSGLCVGQCFLAQNLNWTMNHQYHQPSRCYSCHSPQHSNKTLESKVGIKAWLESLRSTCSARAALGKISLPWSPFKWVATYVQLCRGYTVELALRS